MYSLLWSVNYNNWKKVKGGNSFLFFYENDNLRICTQKEGASLASVNESICSFGSRNIKNFYLTEKKNLSIAVL